MNRTEAELLEEIENFAETSAELVKRISYENEITRDKLKVKLRAQAAEKTVIADYEISMRGNLRRILKNRFQIPRVKKQHGVKNPDLLADFFWTTKTNLLNIERSRASKPMRRVYHALMLAVQRLSDKDMSEILEELKATAED